MTEWNWQKALTLAERARSHRGSTALRPIIEAGRRRLAKWKAQPPFDSGTLFQQRLDQEGLAELDLLALLSDQGESALQGTPAWTCEVERAFSDPGDDRSTLFHNQSGQDPEILFLELIRPLIGRALHRLREGAQFLAKSYPTARLDVGAIDHIFLDLLPARLLPMVSKTVALELNVARVQGLLRGETGEERFASFINRIRQPQVCLEIFREYPVLARQVVTILDQWVGCSMEFLQRWCADSLAVRDTFSPAKDPGPIVSIEADAGDSHRGGRAVWILECSSGLKLVYKPKSMAVDLHFQELLGWLNQRGLSTPFRPLLVLNRGAYGWEQFVSPCGCSSRQEVARFYQRTGGYVALLYSLAATDFHHANLLAVGEHPVLFDLEALFHPSGLEPLPEQAGDIAERSFGDSVLGSGLLPVPVWGGRESGVFDLSGLGAQAGRKIPMHASIWKGKGTDEMHFARETQLIESSSHRPTLNGVVASPLDYLDEIEAGFREAYGLLERHRDELLASDGPIERFADDEVRVVLRNSSFYAELLQQGSHPDVLRDALDRDRLFDRLWEAVSDRPRLAHLIPVETEDLWLGDIPLFTTRPGSRDLWASTDRRFPEALNETGLDRARQRFNQLGNEDLKRQLWFLRGSLTTLASAARPASRLRTYRSDESAISVDRARLLAASCAVGDRLAETALRGAGDVTWIGLNLVRQKQWVLMPLGLDLYDGVPGIVLFLAYLGAVSGQQQYTELARAAFDTVRRKIGPGKPKQGFKQIGAFVGWGGLLYVLAHLSVLWSEPALLAEAHELVEGLPERVARDQDLDIISGAAGCIAGLLCVQSCRPSARVLEVARQCGAHLLAKVRQMSQGLGWPPSFSTHAPLTGFSHGAAGISWALLQLSAHTGEERFRTAALGGITYERSLFCAEAANWPDLRMPDIEPDQSPKMPQFPVAWCHGAPGVGLARLLCLRLLNDPIVDREIETALRTTLAKGFGHSHCLCHGDLGNLELLLQAAQVWPQSHWGQDAQRQVTIILTSISHDGWFCGNPLAVESPGLMTGLAGIGYQLLRCANPTGVPSVLCLAPPLAGSVESGPA